MRNVLLLSTWIFVVAFATAFAPVNDTRPESAPADPWEFGDAFITAIAEKKFEKMKPLLPGVEEWKVLSPEMTKGLEDGEIEEKIKNGNLPKIKAQFDELIQTAKKKNLKLKEIDFNNTVLQRYYKDESAPVGIEILFFYDHYNDKFHVSAVQIEGKWYLLEILHLEKAFANIPDGESSLFKKMGFN